MFADLRLDGVDHREHLRPGLLFRFKVIQRPYRLLAGQLVHHRTACLTEQFVEHLAIFREILLSSEDSKSDQLVFDGLFELVSQLFTVDNLSKWVTLLRQQVLDEAIIEVAHDFPKLLGFELLAQRVI